MAETREPSERYAGIARSLLDEEECLADVACSGARIAYLASDQKKTSGGRTVLGTCEKVPAKYRWCVPYDFTITVFDPNVADLSDEQLRVLLLHELMHVGVDHTEDGERYSIVHHDLEDFRAIVDRFGASWAEPCR